MSKNKLHATGQQKSGLFRLVRRIRRDEKGATAVEFGIIAIPFIALIVALLETALVQMTTLDLENAVKDASRQIRTGQAQTASLTATQFKDRICNETTLIPSCKTTSDLVVDVKSYDDFDAIDIDPSDYYDDDGNFTGTPDFSMGGGLRVVVVQVFYKMELLAQIPTIGLANAGPRHRMLNAISVFRNEPF